MNIWDWAKTWASRYHWLVRIDYKATKSWELMRKLYTERGRL